MSSFQVHGAVSKQIICAPPSATAQAAGTPKSFSMIRRTQLSPRPEQPGGRSPQGPVVPSSQRLRGLPFGQWQTLPTAQVPKDTECKGHCLSTDLEACQATGSVVRGAGGGGGGGQGDETCSCGLTAREVAHIPLQPRTPFLSLQGTSGAASVG